MGYSSGEPPLLSLLGDENSHSRRHRSMLFSVDNSSSARLHIFGRDHHIQSPTGYTPSNQSTGGALRRALSDPWWYMTLRVVCLALLTLVLCTRRILRWVRGGGKVVGSSQGLFSGVELPAGGQKFRDLGKMSVRKKSNLSQNVLLSVYSMCVSIILHHPIFPGAPPGGGYLLSVTS